MTQRCGLWLSAGLSFNTTQEVDAVHQHLEGLFGIPLRADDDNGMALFVGQSFGFELWFRHYAIKDEGRAFVMRADTPLHLAAMDDVDPFDFTGHFLRWFALQSPFPWKTSDASSNPNIQCSFKVPLVSAVANDDDLRQTLGRLLGVAWQPGSGGWSGQGFGFRLSLRSGQHDDGPVTWFEGVGPTNGDEPQSVDISDHFLLWFADDDSGQRLLR